MKKTILFLFLIFGCQYIIAQDKYDKLWEKVEQFELEGKNKSASEVVNKILKKASRSKKSDQIVKSFIYKSKFSLLLDEDAQQKIILEIEGYIKTTSFPTNALLESVYGSFLQQYLEKNKYKISKRSKISDSNPKGDFKTWDIYYLVSQIGKHYQNSLEREEELKKLPIDDYIAILTESRSSSKYRPSLFDFLANRAIENYKIDRWYLNATKDRFYINDPVVFESTTDFVEEPFFTLDSINSNRNVLKLYQKLETFHINRDTVAYIDVVLNRLKFSLEETTLKNKDSLYINMLNKISLKYKDYEVSSVVDFQIANFHYNSSVNYNAKNDPRFKNIRIKAHTICENVIEKFPLSDGGFLCKLLKNKIEEQTLSITIEEYIMPNKPFLGMVNFKSVDSLYISIYKIPYNYFKSNKSYLKDSLILEAIKAKQRVASEFYKLQPVKNFYKYSTEIILPEVPIGNYLIVASQEDEISSLKQLYGYDTFSATNLTLLNINKNKEVVLRVLDRESGHAINNANITVENGANFYKTGKTNKLGEYAFKKDNKYQNNTKITASFKGDTIQDSRFYVNRVYSSDEDEEHIAKAEIFLDRSIYRPGQTIYFKALLFEEKKGKTKVVPNVYVYVAILDANYDELKEYRLKTNEFGSVSGEFKLPLNILTGEFSIEIDEDYGDEYGNEDSYWEKIDDFEYSELYFSVEEYKRPKFEVLFDAVEENYKIGDSIKISGNAKAFLGSTISDAKVSYEINRELRENYYGGSEIIETGVIKTEADGKFKIQFVAIPDSLISKGGKPVFTYTIKADVTDINGETQSNKTNVYVGYHNLSVSLVMQNKLKTNQEQNIQVITQNLNGKDISADVDIEIYKLKEPDRILRKKPWDLVELQNIPKNKYIELFPNEVYDSLDLSKNWIKESNVFSSSFNTLTSNSVKLTNISEWISGTYIVEVSATDVFNDTVTQEKRIEVISPNQDFVSKNIFFEYEPQNTQFKKDKKVSLKLKTPIKGLPVMVEAIYKGKIIYKKLITVTDYIAVVDIPIFKKYKNKIDVNLSFVRFNSLYSDQFAVNFPVAEKELMVETISFRNKLTPDQKEVWSFKITNSDSEKTQAEVLASMYDASLDKFKEHFWKKKIGFRNYNYNYTPRVQSKGFFGLTSFKNFIDYRSYNPSEILKNYHHLNWFGFNFGNTTHQSQRYLNSLSYNNSSQEPHIKGNIGGLITDNSGLPLPGVNVMIKGTRNGTQTDFDGYYSINAPKGSILVFSYVGFITVEVSVPKKGGTINWAMEEDAAMLEEVVVTALGIKKEKKALGYAVSYVNAESVSDDITRLLEGKVAGVEILEQGTPGANNEIIIRGMNSFNSASQALFIIDGVPMDFTNSEININPSDIESIDVLKGVAAITLYGTEGKNGVILITTKKAMEELTQVEARDDLKETAFFFPHLRTNKDGEVFINFNSPQALTKWKFMLLAHNKNLEIGGLSKTAFTQKDINVLPNTPRFLRERDTIIISTKISNLTTTPQIGLAQLLLFDALTLESIDEELMNLEKTKHITISAKGNVAVSWSIVIPEGLQALQYKIVAKAGSHSDGESNVLPVLTNRVLITETKPLWVQSGKTRKVTFKKLKTKTSKTQKNHRYTFEYTSNPAWLAIKSLPYLMEFPHECAEQTFARFYSNTLASSIVNKDPKIKKVFDSWRESGAIESELEKNEELKSILISETPWLREMQSDRESKVRLANLFDEEKLLEQQLQTINKLGVLQHSSGGFPWFSGGRENTFITRHIVAGFGHLEKLNAQSEYDFYMKSIIREAIKYLDLEFIKSYKFNIINKNDSTKISLNHNAIQYLYARSYYIEKHPFSTELTKIIDLYLQESKESWLRQSIFNKGMIALYLNRMDYKEVAGSIIEALREQAVHSEENGMYWKENTPGWYWYNSPIETQALLIEAFSEIENDTKSIEQLKMWLLKNKRTNQWNSTKATTEATYALLLTGNDWLSIKDNTIITIGKEKIKTSKLKATEKEAGTGYMKVNWDENEIKPEMAEVTVLNKSKVTGYGGVYWQYFEDLDAVTSSEEDAPLHIKKEVYLKKTSDKGAELFPISEKDTIKIGDLITVRLEITSTSDMEFIHLKDLRASGLEPVDVLSEYKWQDGLGYYQSTKDVATHFFFDKMPIGKYIFEYDLRANNSGNFSNGITSIQSMYAPEFGDYSKGIRIQINE